MHYAITTLWETASRTSRILEARTRWRQTQFHAPAAVSKANKDPITG